MSTTIAFDVYGTLIDPLGIAAALQDMAGDRAAAVASTWRARQLDYLFRRALGRRYEPFSVCTAQAFDYACLQHGLQLTDAARRDILRRYTGLPAYPGVAEALGGLGAAGYRCFAFSNGEPDDLQTLLAQAQLLDSLDGIVSVHATRTYKPDPVVYQHFLQATGSQSSYTWLVSGNPFDVIGAHHAGWKTAWLRRDPGAIFDPWGVAADATIDDLGALAAHLV